LGAKKITILLFPEGTNRVTQFKIPRYIFVFLCLVVVCAALAVAWGVRDYLSMKTTIPHVAVLEKENKHQKVQLITLAQKIDRISRKLVELKEFDNKLKIMVNLEPDEDNAQFLGIGGSDPSILNPDYTIEKAHKKLVRLMHQSVSQIDTEISIQRNDKAELYRYLENQKSLLVHTPSIWPVKGWVSSRFGYRISPFTNQKEFHRGLDISSRIRAPIVAPADGVVSSIGVDYGYGKILSINHGYGLKTAYAHLNKFLVKRGQRVKRGQKIALVGKTGRTTGPHLHYEVHLNGVPVNPQRYILN